MKIFSEFKPVSAKEWEEKILKDLKIESISELLWKTDEQLTIKPFYTIEDLNENPLPTLFNHTNWEIVQFLPTSHHSDEELNEHLLKSLNGGSSGINMTFFKNHNFTEIFNNISLPHIYSNLNISFDALDLLEKYKEVYFSINPTTQQKLCFINLDPIYLFEYFGEWHYSSHQDDFKILNQFNHIPVNATLYKESGANITQELAYTLSHLNEYLFYLEQNNSLKQYKHIHIQVSIGHSFFSEISKLRSLGILVQHLLKEYNHSASIHIHAQTTLINKSYLDIYNNLIRTTTEAISAIFGGANSISILPYDYPFQKISDFSLRMARNQLLIMKEESFLNKVADVSVGNYFTENYTKELTNAAYQKFLQIEKSNGLVSCLENASIQNEIALEFEKQLQNYINNQSILIGVNKYPNPKQEKLSKTFYKHSINNSVSLKPRRFAEYFEEKFEKEHLQHTLN
ncbi:MAG: methylmalonyl-CoA mutase [Bacteroidia bacterium]|nr:MAG: methylmalonyl-CoA mutase [Bacteroidia bacterium]